MNCFGSEKGNLKIMELEKGVRGTKNGRGREEERREIIFAEQPLFFRMTKRKI